MINRFRLASAPARLATCAVCALFLGSIACNDIVAPIPGTNEAARASATASLATGSHFAFHAPLGPGPQVTGMFDPGLLSGPFAVGVTICAWNGTACTATISTYTGTAGSGGERIRVDSLKEIYVVNWKTKDFPVAVGKQYRILVEVAGSELGHVDVQLVKSGSKPTAGANYVGVDYGITLPIKFRVEDGAFIGVRLARVAVGPNAPAAARAGITTFASLIERKPAATGTTFLHVPDGPQGAAVYALNGAGNGLLAGIAGPQPLAIDATSSALVQARLLATRAYVPRRDISSLDAAVLASPLFAGLVNSIQSLAAAGRPFGDDDAVRSQALALVETVVAAVDASSFVSSARLLRSIAAGASTQSMSCSYGPVTLRKNASGQFELASDAWVPLAATVPGTSTLSLAGRDVDLLKPSTAFETVTPLTLPDGCFDLTIGVDADFKTQVALQVVVDLFTAAVEVAGIKLKDELKTCVLSSARSLVASDKLPALATQTSAEDLQKYLVDVLVSQAELFATMISGSCKDLQWLQFDPSEQLETMLLEMVPVYRGVKVAAWLALRIAYYYDANRYWDLKQVIPVCVVNGEITQCSRPATTPDPNAGNKGTTWGDPHLQTIDGRIYHFQATGDFVLAKSTDPSDDFEIQVRYVGSDGSYSYGEAVAMRVNGDVVNVFPSSGGSVELIVNGQVVPGTNGLALQLPGGGAIAVKQGSHPLGFPIGLEASVSWPDRTLVKVIPSSTYTNFTSVFFAPSRMGKVEGLLGNYNADTTDDVRIRNGSVIDPTPANLYSQFRTSWRVALGTSASLFQRGPDPWNPSYPTSIVGIGDLNPTQAQQAKTVCENAGVVDLAVLDACILDVVLTGDNSVASVSSAIDPAVISVTISPALSYLNTSANKDFAAVVNGTTNRNVTWSANGGTISVSGPNTMTYTAPATPGNYTVSARSSANGATATASVVVSAPVTVGPFDAAAQVSGTSNPNGTWAYGWSMPVADPSAALAFQPYTQTQALGSAFAWTSAASFYPFVGVGQSGYLNLHPGCGAGEWSVLRWTAPASGSFTVQGEFLNGDFGETEAWILKNGSLAVTLFHAAATSADPSFAFSTSLIAGETIDAVVGPAGSCTGDTTPLALKISAASP